MFSTGEVSVDVVLASACLPLIHHTIEIDGEPYWDGGYSANPPLIPLVLASKADASADRAGDADEIGAPADQSKRDRQAARTDPFQRDAQAELEALKYGMFFGATPKLRRLRIGRISAQEEFVGLADESAGNLGWEFLERLRASGAGAVEAWLDETPRAPERTPTPPDIAAGVNAARQGGGAALTVAQIYSKRCDRASSPSFAFGGDDRFVLKGETGSRVADAWLFFAKGDAFDGAGRKVRLEMSENDGALYTKLDPAELATNATLAICPTAKAPGTGKAKCSSFDLAGFARAYDFVCDAK